MACPDCSHLTLEHDKYGCKHAACDCDARVLFSKPPPEKRDWVERLEIGEYPELDMSITHERDRVYSKQYNDIEPHVLTELLTSYLANHNYIGIIEAKEGEHEYLVYVIIGSLKSEVPVSIISGKNEKSTILRVTFYPALSWKVFTKYFSGDPGRAVHQNQNGLQYRKGAYTLLNDIFQIADSLAELQKEDAATYDGKA
jgi:hypothetical protein